MDMANASDGGKSAARRIVYYVSGHGFGHGRRAAEVMREVLSRDSSVRIEARTSAPAWLFGGLGERVTYHAADVDPGCAEKGTLAIDADGTAARVERFFEGYARRAEAEAAFVRQVGASLIVADVPFLAGDVARVTGVPCVAVSNFTWDWIFEELFAPLANQARTGLVRRIRESYGGMETLLRIPWGGVADTFGRVAECPLIARRSGNPLEAILREAGIDAGDRRPRVLLAMRGGISAETLARAAASAPECLFLCPGEGDPRWPGNVKGVKTSEGRLDFSDLLAASDVVLSKLGYGTVAECIAARKRLLWPRRVGFREDALSEREAKRFIAMRELPMGEFTEGRWGGPLRALLEEPMPEEVARTDGAAACAEWVVQRLGT